MDGVPSGDWGATFFGIGAGRKAITRGVIFTVKIGIHMPGIECADARLAAEALLDLSHERGILRDTIYHCRHGGEPRLVIGHSCLIPSTIGSNMSDISKPASTVTY